MITPRPCDFGRAQEKPCSSKMQQPPYATAKVLWPAPVTVMTAMPLDDQQVRPQFPASGWLFQDHLTVI
jgi:hypothetical protein